jgi:hypothetical protein
MPPCLSLSPPRAAILSVSSDNGRCNAFAISQGALIRGQEHRYRLGLDRLDNRVRRGRKEAADRVRAQHGLGLGSAVAVEGGPARAVSGRPSLSANRTKVSNCSGLGEAL